MKRAVVIVLAAMATAVVGCSAGNGGGGQGGSQGASSTAASPLSVDEYDANRTVGRFDATDGALRFSAITLGHNQVSVTLVVNGHLFEGTLDGDSTIIDGHDAVLTDADCRLLRDFALTFSERFSEGTVYQRDASLYGLAAYLSKSSSGYVHSRLQTGGGVQPLAATTVAAPIFGNEGVTCIKVGTTVNASFTGDPHGTVIYSVVPVVVGSNWGRLAANNGDYSCMGKCSVGCGWFGGGYTKDCLDHDTCSYTYASTGGASDKNCGDEYKAAADDFFNGCPTN